MEASGRPWTPTFLVVVLVAGAVAGCLGGPDGAANEQDDPAALPACPHEERPAPRGYAAAASGPDGRVRIHSGFDGQGDTHFLIDQRMFYDRWVFDAPTGCWSEEGDSPLLNWVIVHAASSDTYVGYDWHGAEEQPYPLNAANPASEIWTRQGDAAWEVQRRTDLPPRNGPAMAYDPTTERVVLFGGCAVLVALCLDDTWTFDATSGDWTRMEPSTAPPSRSYHAMAYDPRLGAIVLFGGYLGPSAVTAVSDATWIYDVGANEWTQLQTERAPPARAYPQLAYAHEAGRLFLFGGSGDGQQFGDLWYLDVANRTWVEVAVPGGPSPRAWHAMAYSSQAGALVMFGGGAAEGDFRRYTDETWLFYPLEGRWHAPDRR